MTSPSSQRPVRSHTFADHSRSTRALHGIYQVLKPLIPLRMRIAMRRSWAQSKLDSRAHIWPIDAEAGAKPISWPGWPDGKKFALVLTHDVEGRRGLSRVERLKQLEQSRGFRSAFNFVPEGDYSVPDALRLALGSDGFEVGLHGLQHDGRLYASKKQFLAKAARIRTYVQQWNACGFRSPLMQPRLPWLHKLGVEYDCSSFDTDPFEPEPDGVGTIFPFWVSGRDNSGFVELPYTLPQ